MTGIVLLSAMSAASDLSGVSDFGGELFGGCTSPCSLLVRVQMASNGALHATLRVDKIALGPNKFVQGSELAYKKIHT